MAIYNLTGKADIWWQDLKRVKGIREKNINWSESRNTSKRNFYLNSTMKKWLKNSMS